MHLRIQFQFKFQSLSVSFKYLLLFKPQPIFVPIALNAKEKFPKEKRQCSKTKVIKLK